MVPEVAPYPPPVSDDEEVGGKCNRKERERVRETARCHRGL